MVLLVFSFLFFLIAHCGHCVLRQSNIWTVPTCKQISICENEAFTYRLNGQACFRYVTGFDITGVTNTVELNSTNINTMCDCIGACIKANETCASWVWRFTSTNQTSRSCVLYSNFNLPSSVTLGYNLTSTVDAGFIEENPQQGGFVPQCTMPDGISPDPFCTSGALWQVSNSSFLC